MRIYRDYELLGLAAMNAYAVQPGRTALLVVDMQYGSTHADYGFQKLYRSLGMVTETRYFQDRLTEIVIPNIQRLLEGFRQLHQAVVFLTVGSETSDYSDLCVRERQRIAFWRERGIEIPYSRMGDRSLEVIDELRPLPGETVINKTTASAFNSSRFDTHLKKQGLDTLVVTGVGTNYCVEMTSRDASDRGYLPILVEDACATSTPEMHARAIDTMSFYGRVVSTRQLLDELEAAPRPPVAIAAPLFSAGTGEKGRG